MANTGLRASTILMASSLILRLLQSIMLAIAFAERYLLILILSKLRLMSAYCLISWQEPKALHRTTIECIRLLKDLMQTLTRHYMERYSSFPNRKING